MRTITAIRPAFWNVDFVAKRDGTITALTGL